MEKVLRDSPSHLIFSPFFLIGCVLKSTVTPHAKRCLHSTNLLQLAYRQAVCCSKPFFITDHHQAMIAACMNWRRATYTPP